MLAKKTERTEPDWDGFQAWAAERRRKTENHLRSERTDLLLLLRNGNVTGIEVRYDGYGDSGNVSEISATPDGIDLGEIEERLRDFVWEMATMLHPGFEIDDGGEGTLTWDVTKDRIDLDHADFYMERIQELHEDI